MLDQRVLKTPARHPLVVPTQALALAIAAEWEWQVGTVFRSAWLLPHVRTLASGKQVQHLCSGKPLPSRLHAFSAG